MVSSRIEYGRKALVKAGNVDHNQGDGGRESIGAGKGECRRAGQLAFTGVATKAKRD